MSKKQNSTIIGQVQDVPEAGSLAFTFKRGKERLEGFVVKRKGKLHAYVNRCRHMPLSLDFGDNDFFSEDGELLLCRNHGALFEPESGLCVSGPCAGQSLESVVLRVEGETIFYDGKA